MRRREIEFVLLQKVHAPRSQQRARGVIEIRFVQQIVTIDLIRLYSGKPTNVEGAGCDEAAQRFDLAGCYLAVLDQQGTGLPAAN